MTRVLHADSQRRRVLAIGLMSFGALPFVLAALLIAAMVILPNAFRQSLDLIVPPGLDAPDNWAIAITRLVTCFLVSGSVGLVTGGIGWSLFYRRRVTGWVPMASRAG